MTTKIGSSAFAPGERSLYLREILGIVLTLIAVLIFLALLSALGGDGNWIGPVGAWVATGLFFILGHYVAFALPVMIGLSGAYALLGVSPIPRRVRSWMRGLGGILLMVSACAVLALSAGGRTGANEQYELYLGGLIGSMLVDQSGANLGNLFGRVGSFVVFGGLAMIGLVLFTETLLRELVRLTWRAMRGGWQWQRRIECPAWLGACARGVISWRVWRVFLIFGWIGRLAGRVFDWLSALASAPPRQERVMPAGIAGPAGAVKELTARTDGGIVPADELAVRVTDARETPTRGQTVLPRRAAVECPVTPPDFGLHKEKPRAAAVQSEMELFPAKYQLPSLALLSDPPSTIYTMSEEEKIHLGQKIEQTLAQFKVDVQVIEVIQGPVVTRFALKVAPGVRVNRIVALESELAMALKAIHVRVLAPIPGQSAVGVEVPNKRPNPVLLKELLASDEFQTSKSPLSFALGKNIAGEPIICDLAKMPHLLLAGATGSGKSVCLNAIITSLLYRNTPERVKFVMVDPKRVELSIYQAIPHLTAPVVSETRKAAAALAWCVEQMEQRYKIMAEVGVRNIDGYNAVLNDREPNKKAFGREINFLPQIVIIIDELSDLMMVARNEVEEYVIRLAQMARAVGIHLIIATQRPSVNVITGIIKANFPSRIAFQVSSKVDSRTILDMNGAEALMGRGDMLYSPGGVKPFRIQGAFISDAEVERVADTIRSQEKARYAKEDFEVRPTPAERAKAQVGLDEESADDAEDYPDGGIDPCERTIHVGLPVEGRAAAAPLTPADMESLSDEDLYDLALRLILESRKASVSYIQRRMKIGYARAGRIMDLMEERGIVGPYQGSKPRDLLVDPDEYALSDKQDERHGLN